MDFPSLSRDSFARRPAVKREHLRGQRVVFGNKDHGVSDLFGSDKASNQCSPRASLFALVRCARPSRRFGMPGATALTRICGAADLLSVAVTLPNAALNSEYCRYSGSP